MVILLFICEEFQKYFTFKLLILLSGENVYFNEFSYSDNVIGFNLRIKDTCGKLLLML